MPCESSVIINKVSDDEINFTLSDTNKQVATILEYSLKNLVPILSIDWVEIKINNSSHADIIIVRRLLALSIFCEDVIEDVDFYDNCLCKTCCSNCSFEFYIDKECPEDEDAIEVKYKDLIPKDPRLFVSKEVNHNGEDLIAHLKRGQRLKLRAFAKKGIKEDSPKWSALMNVESSIEDVKEEKKGKRRSSRQNKKENKFDYKLKTRKCYRPQSLIQTALDCISEKLKTFQQHIDDIVECKNIERFGITYEDFER